MAFTGIVISKNQPKAATITKIVQKPRAEEQVFLYVDGQGIGDSKSMGVFKMDEEAVKSLGRGKKLSIWVTGEDPEDPNSYKLLSTKMTLRGLSAFIPSVGRAVRVHKEAGGGYITDVVFPRHYATSYNKIFGWMWASIAEGRVVKPARVEKFALRTYQDVAVVAKDLRIGYMVKAMEARVQQMEEAAAKRQGAVSA